VTSWHAVVDSGDPARLGALLADDVVFRSPAVHTPQEGKGLTTTYLAAAMVVLGPTLRYIEEWYGEDSAVLEFEAEIDGMSVQGIDLLRWNDADLLVEFIVMVRPFRGLEKLIELMGRQLSR
jgi:SnoaL-like domain